MAYIPDFSGLTESFSETWVLGVEWIIPLIVIFISMLIITRDVNKWKMLFFPVAVAWKIALLPVHILILVVGAIIFGVEVLSLQFVGNIINTAKKAIGIKSEEEAFTAKLRKQKSESASLYKQLLESRKRASKLDEQIKKRSANK